MYFNKGFCITLILVTTIFGLGFSQTGPGGVGNATGANGQPQNVLWLRGNTGISSSGGLVNSWGDQSGNGNNASGSGSTRPTYNASDANFNNLPSITFPSTASANFYLEVPDNDNLDNTSALSIFFIARPSATPAINGFISKRTSAGVNQSYLIQLTSGVSPIWQTTIGTTGPLSLNNNATSVGQNDIVSMIINGTSVTGQRDGTNQNSTTGPSSIANNTSNLFIGSFDNSVTTNFEGQIAEVLIYKSTLNTAQRQIIENYLSSKYNSALGAGDIYAGDTGGNGNHDFDLAGIGFNGGTSHLLANSQGLILSPSSNSIDTNGEFVLAAHNGVTNAASTSNLGSGGVVQRWARTWYIDKTLPTIPAGSTVDANITFDFSDGIGGQFPQDKDNFVLLRLNTGTGNYDVVTAITSSDKTIIGDQIAFRVTDTNLIDGIYTLGTLNSTTSPVTGVSNRTWYSYQSGNWTDPSNWTLDGSLFPLFVNPSSEIPALTDNVVILSGRTITMNTNNVQINSIEVIGVLDLAATTGHNFLDINGTGRIKIAGTTDNFPSGDATDFADASIGGTLEVNGTGISLNQARTFKNVEINMTGSSDLATIENNWTLNGNLTVTNGIFKINNDVAIANRTVTVNGNVTIASSGGIRVGTTNSRHELNLYGDFTNDGTAYFTQRTSASTESEATDGIVDVNMVSSSRDQAIICNGVTRFYRIEINKGTDDTYKASITASSTGNFNLFGAANYNINEANAAANANGTNLNALGLNAGTIEIGNNVTITSLNTVTNYAIYEGAQLWVNGGSVTKSAGTAIVPYGKLKISDGVLVSSVISGVTLRQNGVFEISGGTATIKEFRTSIVGSGAVGSYVQSGGAVTITAGSGVGMNYAPFSLTYTGNVFSMSGGTLTVNNRPNLGTSNLRGAIFINSDPANVSVTGGTIIMDANNTVNYRVTSRAPFWNVIMRGTGGVRTIELLGTTSGQGGGVDEPSLSIQPLVVLNDFTIEANASFSANNADVSVRGNFEIKNGGTYTHGTNTTTITGIGVSSMIFGNTSATQSFNNLVINKNSSTNEVVITTGNATAIRVNGSLTITSGIFDYGSFIVSAGGALSLASGVTVGKSASTGRIAMDGTADQTLTSNGASIYNLEINNADPTPQVTLSAGNLTVLGTLTMTAGVFDINTRRLTLSGAAATISGSSFGTTKMIQTAGNAGDGGLELYFDANETKTYPIGTNANSTVRFTPVTAQTQSFSDDGLIRISIEDALLKLVNLPATNSLDYNWRVNISSFTTAPLISYQFTYDQFDVTGSEGSFVPGSILTVDPFTRSSEPSSDINTTTNVLTFNGTSTSGTFPGVGSTLLNAAYTAGANGLFTGAPEVFYNRANGQTGWNNDNKWSLIGYNGTATNQQPGDGDVVKMTNFGGTNESWVQMDVNVNVAAIFFENTGGGWLPRVTVTDGRNVSLGVVSGVGEIMVEANGSLPVLNTTDIGDFANQTASTFIYKVENDATYSMYTAFTQYPNLRIEGNNGANNNGLRVMRNTSAITVNRDLWSDWGGTFRAEADVTIGRDLRPGAGGGGGGRIQFGENGSHTITVGRNVTSSNSANNRIEVLNTTPNSRVHSLKVAGSITQTTGVIDLFNGTGTNNNAILELNTPTSGTYTNASGNTPDLFRVVVNKGSSISTTFTMSDNMTLNGPFDQTTKPLVLQNGLLILDDPAISYTLTSGGADFNIPSTAGLEIKQGAVATTTTSTNANLTLDGLLRVSGGTVTIDGGGTSDTNYIEYSNSGNATIEVTGGSLTVAGQVRRALTSTTGVLKYTQSNGTTLVGNESASSTTRGVFEVLNTGSQFNHSGGSFTIVRGINSTTVPSLWLEPATSTITSGSTITIGNTSTPSGVNSQNIGIQSTASLNNLTIAGSNNPVVKIYTSPLTVSGNLLVSTSTTLNANNQDLTIGGNFTVNGSYVPTSNTTTFTNTAAAAISGSTPLFNFYNVTKSGAGILTISKDITVNQDLKVLAGAVSTSTFAINLKRHAQVDGTISSTSGSGLNFNGSVQQQLTRAAAGTSTLGIITINNSTGVIIPDGNGYNFNLSSGLRLQQGVFDIGGSLLFLQTNALITPVNPFSVTNMIQTNSSFTDKGVRKQFPLSYTTDFTFPIGQLYYTPVIFNFSSPSNTTGSSGTPIITVRPANERHPSIVNDDQAAELPDPVTFNDLNNVLQYHWIVNADNVASTFRSTMSLVYPQSLVSVTSPYTEADYLAARILLDANPTKLINKFTTAEVDETANTISFNFTGVTDAGISAEYFAGVDLAIPDNVPVYTTTGSGNVNAAVYTPVVPGGGAPTGATVIVQPGHTLTFNINNVSLYETQISAGATVTIPTGSTGHRLGTITGTGNLRIESNTASAVLPAAVYDDFFSCAGGGLIYAGTGGYEILGGITLLRNLTLEGAGTKVLANNDVTICNDLTINAGTLSNTNNRSVTVQNDVLLNAGTLNTNNGTWSITRDMTQTTGTFNGGTGGTKTIGRNLTINGGSFISGTGAGSNTIRVDGNMTLAGAATFTGGASSPTGLRYLFQGTAAQTITGNFLGTREFNRLEINNSTGLTLAGNVEIERELILTSGNITPGTNQLLMGTNAVANPTEGRATSFVSGRLYKVVSGTGGFTFPIGKGSLWRSGSVTNLSASGDTWDMEYFYEPATSESIVNNLSPTSPILRLSQGEYWKVTDGVAVGRTARVGLSWGVESDVSSLTAEREALQIVVWNDALTRWDNYGGTNFSAGHTQTRGTFNSSSNISFSENIVTLGSTEVANPLPVELVEFKGRNENGFNILKWRTASELNNDFFEVERSSDGESFVYVGRVAGNGTTQEEHNYELVDEEAFIGNNYYRLKQVDFDGSFAYSNVILVKNEIERDMFALSVFPNPVAKGNSIKVRTQKDNEFNATVTMFDVTGKGVMSYSTDKAFFENTINLSEDIKSGVYHIEMRQGNKRVVRRLVID
jgi:hypothetical protein